MIRVVDTSAWIEGFIRGGPESPLRAEMPKRADCVVPTIVQFELMKWLTREAEESLAAEIIAYTQKCTVVSLSSRIALLAAQLAPRHKLATADALIYATAIAVGADLLTCDAHFDGLDHVVYLKKSVG